MQSSDTFVYSILLLPCFPLRGGLDQDWTLDRLAQSFVLRSWTTTLWYVGVVMVSHSSCDKFWLVKQHTRCFETLCRNFSRSLTSSKLFDWRYNIDAWLFAIKIKIRRRRKGKLLTTLIIKNQSPHHFDHHYSLGIDWAFSSIEEHIFETPFKRSLVQVLRLTR